MSDASSNNGGKDYYFELGIGELDSGNFKKAIHAFKKAIKLDPEDHRIYNNLGIAYELSQDYENARAAYEKAVKINPKNSSILSNLAGLSLLEGKPDYAAALYDSAITADPLFVEPYMNLARMFIEMRDFAAAEPYVKSVLDIEPENAEAHNLMGVISSVSERSEEAVAHFQNAIRSDANQASVFSNLGTALHKIGDAKRAIIAYEKSNELNPNSLSILNNLGVLYRETGNFDNAVHFFEKAMKYYPDYPFPYVNMAELYIEREDYGRALDYLKSYSAIVPLDMDMLYKTCGVARMADKLPDVVEEMERFVEEAEPDDSRLATMNNWLNSVH